MPGKVALRHRREAIPASRPSAGGAGGRGTDDGHASGGGGGASCVEAYDALGGLKSLDELKRKIEAGWGKQEA